MCRSPVPSVISKTTNFSHDRPFQRGAPDRASYGGTSRYRSPSLMAGYSSNNDSVSRPGSSNETYQPFQRLAARSASFRHPRTSASPTLLGSSTPRPYVPLGRLGLDEQKRLIAQQRATIRDHFFQTPLTAPPLISSVMSSKPARLSLPTRTDNHMSQRHQSPARSTVSSNGGSKKYYETDLDLTIKVPKNKPDDSIKKGSVVGSSDGSSVVTSSPASRVINISVTKSESLNYVSQLNETNGNNAMLNKENAVDDIKITERPNFARN